MRKKIAEEFFDKFAKDYSSDNFPSSFNNSRTAMSFADDITWHFILKYLPKTKSCKILDAGAGDGFWAQKLVEKGYQYITLLDLSRGMLEEAKIRFSKLKITHNVSFIKSDIIDMKELDNNYFNFVFSQYDAVSICLKPIKAIKELARVAKIDSCVVVSLDTKYRRVPELIEIGQLDLVRELLETNISHDFDFPQYNLTWEELAKYFEEANLEVLEVIGAPVFMHQVNKKILSQLELNPEIRAQLLKIELENCTNKTLVNFAGHLQIVGKKIK